MKQYLKRYIPFGINIAIGCVNLWLGLSDIGWSSLSLVLAGFSFGIAAMDLARLYYGTRFMPLSPKVQAQWDREIEEQIKKDAFMMVNAMEAEMLRRGLRGKPEVKH